MKNITFFMAVLAALICSAGCSSSSNTAEYVRPMTVITTDGEVDDYDSMVRMLLYSNNMDIRGFVYSASQWHWEGDGKGTLLKPENRVQPERNNMMMPGGRQNPGLESMRWIGTKWIQDLIDAYAECYENLRKHDPNYPSPEYLHSIVKMGNTRVEGDIAAPTEGSDFIKGLLLSDESGPLYLQIWGGTNTVARALLSIEEQYKGTSEWDGIHRKVSDKAVLYIIQGQDGTYNTYIEKKWPEIRTIHNGSQFYGIAYGWRQNTPEPWLHYMQGSWFRENIINNHGKLPGKYLGLGIPYPFNDPDDRFGDPETVKRIPGADFNDFISEGDSPAFFHLFDFLGLRSLEHPEWGSAGGRFLQSRDHYWDDPMAEGGFSPFRRPDAEKQDKNKPKVIFNRSQGDFNPYKGEVDMFYPQMRWIEVLQNDFAARADWCVKSYTEANHAPVAAVRGDLDLNVRSGQKVTLQGTATDPDKEEVTLQWWQYREAGTSDAELDLKGADGASVSFIVPADAQPGETFHMILEAADSGTPVLRHFQRVILTVI